MSQGVGDNKREPEIYLDNNATTQLHFQVLEAITRVWRDCGANPASQHAAGRKARRLVEESRERILELLGARTAGMSADRLIFTSGGTEANHLALHGIAELQTGSPRSIAISALEHPSIQAAAEQLRQRGVPIDRIPVLPSGVVHVGAIEQLLAREPASQPRLVSLMLASNETGVLQPVADVARIAAAQDVLVHTDAVQAVGKVSVNFRELGVAALTLTPHKFHGPIGIGGLVVRNDVQLQPQLLGGFQQGGLRAGTESAALAVGFCRALEICLEELDLHSQHMRLLRDQFTVILQHNLPKSVVIGQDVPRTPLTLCISFPPLDRQALVMALDLAGVACSTGSACASGSSEPSPTLLAMGLSEEVVGSAIRFSLSLFTTAAEVGNAAKLIINTVKHLQHGR